MRHLKKGSKLNRTAAHRRALMGNLITSLILHERIRTTTAKAKAVRPLAERMITFAKRGDLHARRQVLRLIKDKTAVSKLFETLGERFKERPGGYTRILRLSNRSGDNAEMALLELVTEQVTGKGAGRKRRRRSKKQEAPAAAAPAAQQQAAESEESPVAEAAPVEEAAAVETEAPAAEPAAEEEKKN